MIIAGHRRVRAAIAAGLTQIAVLVAGPEEDAGDDQLRALMENAFLGFFGGPLPDVIHLPGRDCLGKGDAGEAAGLVAVVGNGDENRQDPLHRLDDGFADQRGQHHSVVNVQPLVYRLLQQRGDRMGASLAPFLGNPVDLPTYRPLYPTNRLDSRPGFGVFLCTIRIFIQPIRSPRGSNPLCLR